MRAAFFALLLIAVSVSTVPTGAQNGPAVPAAMTPNYELAARWTTAKINKQIFDTAVTPHWLETSDRFWYSYETRDGKKYFLVDPLKKSKGALFDNAKMAALLTSATLVPMDAQHLPIKTLKVVKNDTTLLLEVEVPKDAEIPGLKKEPVKPTTSAGADKQGERDDDELLPGGRGPRIDEVPQQRRGVQGGDGDDEENSDKKSVFFEYDLGASRLSLLPEFKDPKKPRWASV